MYINQKFYDKFDKIIRNVMRQTRQITLEEKYKLIKKYEKTIYIDNKFIFKVI